MQRNGLEAHLCFAGNLSEHSAVIGGVCDHEIDAQLKQEIFKDFFAKLKYFENYDSDPPEGANIKRDRGIVFSLGWSK